MREQPVHLGLGECSAEAVGRGETEKEKKRDGDAPQDNFSVKYDVFCFFHSRSAVTGGCSWSCVTQSLADSASVLLGGSGAVERAIERERCGGIGIGHGCDACRQKAFLHDECIYSQILRCGPPER